MKTTKYFSLAVAATALFISGCASGPKSNTSASPSPSQSTVAAQPTAPMPDVPAIKVSVDCGACTVKPTIPALIVEGYTEAARAAGRKVSATAEATLTIKEYTSRNDAARFFAGAFAGKDEIKVVIAYQGKTYAVEDYYRNAWLGIDTLAKKIGEMSYAELK